MVYWGHKGGSRVTFWLTTQYNHGHGYSIEALLLLSCSYLCCNPDVLKIHTRAKSIDMGLPKIHFKDKRKLNAHQVSITAPIIAFLVKYYPHSSIVSRLKRLINAFKIRSVRLDLDLVYCQHLALNKAFQSIQDSKIFGSFTKNLEYINCMTYMTKFFAGSCNTQWFQGPIESSH